MNEGPAEAAGTGVEHAAALLTFADAVVGRDPQAITAAREALVALAGRAALCDAAAIVANFQRMVRIADGCGIPLDAPMQALGREALEELRLDRFAAAAHTPQPRVTQRLMAPFIRLGLRFLRRWTPHMVRRRTSAS